MTQIYSKYFSCEDGTGWVDGEGCAPASVAQKFSQNNCSVAQEYNEVSKCRRWSIQYFKFSLSLGGQKFSQNNCSVAQIYNKVSKCRRWLTQKFKFPLTVWYRNL